MQRSPHGEAMRHGALLAFFVLFGCVGRPGPVVITPPASELRAGLVPGDAVRVNIWQEPDLTGEYMVAPNGSVVFPLLGERVVAGVASETLEGQLETEYRRYLNNPSVDVTVLRRIAILGEVREPGLYPVDATITLRDALALAGGLSPNGDQNDIRLTRDGVVLVHGLDASQSIATTPIRSGDQIEVGQRSWISRNMAIVTTGIAATTSIVVALILQR